MCISAFAKMLLRINPAAKKKQERETEEGKGGEEGRGEEERYWLEGKGEDEGDE